jgi:hypothetical protein
VRRLILVAALVVACGGEPDYFTEEELRDPQSCEGCHPQHFREWSGSMHAYASFDPVFRAMNARGQEETDGELGDFCVQCHAPLAVRYGLTEDGTDLDDVPDWAQGVTCFFCHSVESIGDEHNNDITLASDGVMRGGLSDPVPSPKHRSAYSELVDTDNQASSAMCGSCHDLVTPAGVHLEKTFEEWKTTIFADEDPRRHLSCGECHMVARTGAVAEDPDLDVPLREFGVREHTFAAVDLAVTPFPEIEAQRAAIERDLATTVLPRICLVPLDGGRLDVRLDNVAAGHMFPSGAAHDRRAWVEIRMYDAEDVELRSIGVVADGVDPDPVADPQLWEMREQAFDDEGQPVLYFWEVREVDDSWLLRPTVTLDPLDPDFDHSTTRQFPVFDIFTQIARITVAVHLRPLPYAVIDDLEASGHLPPAVAAEVRENLPTFTLRGSQLEWRDELADAGGCVNP